MKSFRRLVYPYLVWAALLIVVPMLIVVFYAFTKSGNSILTVRFTLENITKFFSDKLFVEVLLRSVKIAIVTTIACILIGYPAAYFMAQLKPNSQSTMVL